MREAALEALTWINPCGLPDRRYRFAPKACDHKFYVLISFHPLSLSHCSPSYLRPKPVGLVKKSLKLGVDTA